MWEELGLSGPKETRDSFVGYLTHTTRTVHALSYGTYVYHGHSSTWK